MACASFELTETDDPNTYKIVLQPTNTMVELTQKGKTLQDGYTTSSSLEVLNNANLRVIFTDYGKLQNILFCKERLLTKNTLIQTLNLKE